MYHAASRLQIAAGALVTAGRGAPAPRLGRGRGRRGTEVLPVMLLVFCSLVQRAAAVKMKGIGFDPTRSYPGEGPREESVLVRNGWTRMRLLSLMDTLLEGPFVEETFVEVPRSWALDSRMSCHGVQTCEGAAKTAEAFRRRWRTSTWSSSRSTGACAKRRSSSSRRTFGRPASGASRVRHKA